MFEDNKFKMFTGFEKIVEERIKKAQKNGAFDKLAGSGKPFDFSDETMVPNDLRIAYKILKNADFIPPEIELKKKILQTEDLLAEADGIRDKYKLLKKLNFLIMKLNSMQNRSMAFEMPQHYSSKFVERFKNGSTLKNTE